MKDHEFLRTLCIGKLYKYWRKGNEKGFFFFARGRNCQGKEEAVVLHVKSSAFSADRRRAGVEKEDILVLIFHFSLYVGSRKIFGMKLIAETIKSRAIYCLSNCTWCYFMVLNWE